MPTADECSLENIVTGCFRVKNGTRRAVSYPISILYIYASLDEYCCQVQWRLRMGGLEINLQISNWGVETPQFWKPSNFDRPPFGVPINFLGQNYCSKRKNRLAAGAAPRTLLV